MNVLTSKGLVIYDEKIKQYLEDFISNSSSSSQSSKEELSETEPTDQKNGDVWLKKL